jgi:hypothetical protein
MIAKETRKPLERILSYTIVFLALLFLVEVVFLVEVFFMSLFIGTGNGGTGSEPVFEFDASPAQLAPLPPLDDFQELVDRSLFAWNRQPRASGKQAGDQEEVDISEWYLSGVVNHAGRNSLAIFVADEGDESLALETGMYLGSWEIERIDEESVIVLKGEKEQVIRLETVDIELPEDKVAQQSEKPAREPRDKTSRDEKGSSSPGREGDGELTPLQKALKKAPEK